MGAIFMCIELMVIALVGVIYFTYQDRKAASSKQQNQ
jgi:cell division protein FtsL